MNEVLGDEKGNGGIILNPQALELAKRIVELDLQRDAVFEQLIVLVGERAYELLRAVQNQG
ncbi:hypothetical protein HNQ34_002579 [Anoxybacillus tepidamans]|uniref:Uncharacterized protein n=1 Tax=Anoxybacteroides tepidamans TaxID=265948 RepID=A0A7W8IRM6_9BACL|nr:hypothetical protein [Anoxybacillus tepidamans]MBB5325478.1 hypothetical protein [Anoxybacillus tepidamans]